MSTWDRWQNDETWRDSQLAINWSDAWVRHLGLRIVDEDEHLPYLQQRSGYQDANKALVDMHKQVRQDCGVSFIPKVERQRLRNQFVLQCEGILSGWALIVLSTLHKNDPSRHLLLSGHQVHPGRSQEVDPGTRKRCRVSNTKSKVVGIISWQRS